MDRQRGIEVAPGVEGWAAMVNNWRLAACCLGWVTAADNRPVNNGSRKSGSGYRAIWGINGGGRADDQRR